MGNNVNINYGLNDFNGNEQQIADAFLGGMVSFIVVMLIFFAMAAIFMVIVKWFLFKKGDKPGWAAIIPIYSDYILCKMVGVNPWWILIVILSGFASFIPFIGSLISMAASIYFAILIGVSLARAFGKEDGFAVGLILLPIVFQAILAFGKDQYIGINPMKDIIFKNNQETTDNNVTAKNKFCTNCGKKVETNEKFCTNCGNKIK